MWDLPRGSAFKNPVFRFKRKTNLALAAGSWPNLNEERLSGMVFALHGCFGWKILGFENPCGV